MLLCCCIERKNGYTAEPGVKAYLEEHIPGAGFIDLLNDWSDTDSPFK